MPKLETSDMQDIINVKLRGNYKRAKCKEEADKIIKKINQQLSEKEVELNALDPDRLDIIQKINESSKNGDLRQIENLIERLR